MAGSREIRNKIKSIKNTQKITKAMEMVAASKMRKAQERMRASRPYALNIARVMMHLARANTEYKHPFLVKRGQVRRVGIIVVTSDKGLCGGLNTNVLRLAVNQMKEWQAQGIEIDVCAIGNKGFSFMQRMGANIVSHVTNLGDTPHLERLIGPVKVLLDSYSEGRIDELHAFYNRFVNTMKQDPVQTQMLPIPPQLTDYEGKPITELAGSGLWDYLYEPEAKPLLDAVFTRAMEAAVYQYVVENMASEQSARMVAMKAASDNAGNLIDELTLIYNKTRQAAITKEISEIVGGAAAVS
ncbi:F0F1 ATP synthase subunit gamma [Pelomicrobium methylotrophicum]|uniref:ATP synthase gamma chain n=1 Tax=Pelomicrobium methylotrophicum TaxID=2602750 RepID=A0A5C7EW86_9PROT|nr:F0F1 ATP synthase subunit gamma [Pelomicrobium methylotrophicum]TXF13255.1 F0F1 ATP synthase subunit gamma [Pelomicrobium methylotrophicum]